MLFVYLFITAIALTIQTQPAISTQTTATQTTANPVSKNLPPAIPVTYAFNYEANVIFQAISLPLQDVQDSFTLNIFAEIDKNFGSTGLNLNQNQISFIKKTYLYLIFLTKLDLVKNNPSFKKYQPDFTSFLSDNKSPLPHIPDATLVKSAGWNAITITTQDISNSTMWQLFCKASISDAYGFFYTALNIIHNVEQQTFNYIPHIETSFYDHDYTNLRTINELTRLKIILETTNKDYYLTQCSDWNAQKSSTAKNTPIEQSIAAFRQTNFYKNTHDIYTLLGVSDSSNPTISTQSLLTPKQLTSPLKEHVWCFFMLNELLTMFYGLITPDSIENILTYCSQDNLQPKIFPYSIDDYVYFEELLAVKSKTENTHTQSLHPSPPVHKVEQTHVPIALHKSLQNIQKSLNQTVKTQCCSWFTDIVHTVSHAITSTADDIASVATTAGHDIENAAEQAGTAIVNTAENVGQDIKNAAEEAGDAISQAAKAAIHATVGIAEGVFGEGVGLLGNITGIESIEEFGSKVQKDAISNLQQATSDLQNSINDMAKGLDDAINAAANIDGTLVSIITDDQKLGQDMQSIYNQLAGALVNIAAKYSDLVVQATGDYYIDTVRFNEQFANLVGSAVNAIATGNLSNLEKNAKKLLDGTIKSITSTFSNLVSDAKSVLGAVMQGLGAVINSLTTIFIDISREITFMVMSAGNIASNILTGQFNGESFQDALDKAAQERDSVTNTLEAHRQTINEVMGVAVAIGFTVATEVATGGAATGADAAIDAALIGGETATETASDIAAETAAETATETAAEAATDTTAEATAETVSQTTSETTSQATSETTSESTSQTSETSSNSNSETSDEPSNEETPKNNEENNNQEAKDESPKEQKDESKWKESLKKGLRIGLKAFGNIINIVFGAFSTISGINADAQDALKEKQQAEQLTNIWEFINDNKIGITQNQQAYLKELKLKQQAAIGNQILNLSFVKNITYANVNQLVQQLSAALSQEFIPLLTPDSNGLLGADIGSSWGIQSPYLNLYPTEGFSSVTTGRPDFPFAQEVAQIPYDANNPQSSSSQKNVNADNSQQQKKLWFNQKVIGLDNLNDQGSPKQPLDPLVVSINLQIIYMIASDFYTGLYLGGNYYDYRSSTYLTNLNSNKNFDIDAAHLAKMVVLFRTASNAALQIGVYEHEGKGWILQEPLPESMQLSNYHTYNVQAQLAGESLTIMVSIDNDPTNSVTKIVTVTALENQRTYGVISSGVAIQWNQLAPAASIISNAQARPTYQKTSEIEREKASKIAMNKSFSPKFGPFNLQAISQQAIMLNQYLYTTTDTNLKKVSPNNQTDYLIFATNQNGTVSNMGTTPSLSTNPKNHSTVAVSLITGNAYNSHGVVVAHCANLWATYQAKFGPFDPTISTYILAAQKEIQTALAHITFGSFDLDIINQTALQNGQYIYSCSQTIQTKGANNSTIMDYLTPAEINGTELGNNIGMPPTSLNAQGLVSLVTGNLYSKSTDITAGTPPNPLSSGYSVINQLGNIDSGSLATITAAQNAYNAYLTSQQTPPTPPKTVTVQTFNSSSATNSSFAPSGTTGPSLGGGPSVNLSGGPGSSGTISGLQQQAAGGTSFQLGTPSGPSVSLGNGP